MFFIHSSFDGHLGRFSLSTVVSNATVNMGIKSMPFEIRLDFQKNVRVHALHAATQEKVPSCHNPLC